VNIIRIKLFSFDIILNFYLCRNIIAEVTELHVKKKIAFYTLGCKLNYAETAMISSKFEDKGYEKVAFEKEADVYVINTCSVTQVADKKCRQAIKKATNKNAKVVVIGCYSQLKPEDIAAIEGVHLVLGTKDKFNVVEHVENLFNGKIEKIHSCNIDTVDRFDASFSTSDRTRAFLKVQDGCDYSCTYCTIPMARGKSRNESIDSTVKQAEIIASKNIKEVVLTGVNIGDFGQSTNENFLGLIEKLDKVEGIERFRISSIEPNLINSTILDFVIQSSKFVQHFHIPLQSGSNKVLAAMSRRYNRELYASRVESIKAAMPFACIGVDVIVGFPGETDEDFLDTYKFIDSIDISHLHVFPYSERPNTKAIEFDHKNEPSVKERRCKLLMELSEQKRKIFYNSNIGREEKVIFESRSINNKMVGFTSNYIKVESDYKKELIGVVSSVKLLEINNNGNFNISFLS
jgi:threonylcarbamoyladenosine tRNA methylthiotransferase MtaB